MISHKRKFIFLHVPKCAGSTLNTFFLKYSDDPEFNAWHPTLKGYSQKYEISNYFKILSSRNPWDRLVSCFFYLKQGGNKTLHDIDLSKKLKIYKSDFKPWIKNHFFEALNLNLKVNHLKPIFFYLSKTAPDFIIKTENLQQDFNTVCDKIGIPQQELPHKNKSKHKHYTEYYDEETKQIVAEKYAKDIEYFGYEFGE